MIASHNLLFSPNELHINHKKVYFVFLANLGKFIFYNYVHLHIRNYAEAYKVLQTRQ